jgi:hypothetical protein
MLKKKKKKKKTKLTEHFLLPVIFVHRAVSIALRESGISISVFFLGESKTRIEPEWRRKSRDQVCFWQEGRENSECSWSQRVSLTLFSFSLP